MTAAGLVAAVEAFLLPPTGAIACAPRMFGEWPGGKSLDEWFWADEVSANPDGFSVAFNQGGDALEVTDPGCWRYTEDGIAIADLSSVVLSTHHVQDVRGVRRSTSRRLAFRTVRGGYLDARGRFRRWSPARGHSRTASRVPPALELHNWQPLLDAARERGR